LQKLNARLEQENASLKKKLEDVWRRMEQEAEETRLITRLEETRKNQEEIDRMMYKITKLEAELRDKDETVSVLEANLRSLHTQSAQAISHQQSLQENTHKKQKQANADLDETPYINTAYDMIP